MQTVEEFKLRWNSYKSNNRKFQKLEPCMQQYLFEHFNSDGHHCFLDEICIIFIDKTEPPKPCLSSVYVLDTFVYVSLYLTFNCTVMDGLLIGYDSQITIFVIY